MSVVTKRKYVFKEVHEEFVLPDETRKIAKVTLKIKLICN